MMPTIQALEESMVNSTKELIAEVVLEFYSDLDFLPKSKAGLLAHYEKPGISATWISIGRNMGRTTASL